MGELLLEMAASCHARTDGSLRWTPGLRWVVPMDDQSTADIIAQGSKSLGERPVAFGAEVVATPAHPAPLSAIWWRRSGGSGHYGPTTRTSPTIGN